MSNKYWQSQHGQRSSIQPGDAPSRSGLLHSFAGPRPASVPLSPLSPHPDQSQSVSQGPPDCSPFPPSQQSLPSQRAVDFLNRPTLVVKRWSDKMAAIYRSNQPPVDPNPLVRYRNPHPPLPADPKPTPWHLSRTQRIT